MLLRCFPLLTSLLENIGQLYGTGVTVLKDAFYPSQRYKTTIFHSFGMQIHLYSTSFVKGVFLVEVRDILCQLPLVVCTL